MKSYSFQEKLAILKQSYKMLGFWMTLRYTIIHLLGYMPNKDHRFDRQYGTDTSGIVYINELALRQKDNRNHAIFYLSAPASVTRFMLNSLPIDYHKFNFVDFGSGKGRVLLLAAEFSFAKISGVELSTPLHECARGNLRRYRNPNQRCQAIELLNMDATRFIPPPENTVFHFYHPFLPDVLKPVLLNIGDSLEKKPRTLYILYLYHIDYVESVFAEMPFLRKVKEVKCVNQQYNWALYAGRYNPEAV